MDRRTLLRNGAVLTALALAGCAGGGRPGDGGTPAEGTGTTAPPTTEPPETIAIEDYSFEVTGRTSATTGPTAEVTVDPDEDGVRVTGTIQGSDGCKTATLRAVDYRRDADEVHVGVATTDRPGTDDKACTQALVYISYQAAVSFVGGVPSLASVSHDGTEVGRGTHDSASAGDGS
jgi:hypothetical protein